MGLLFLIFYIDQSAVSFSNMQGLAKDPRILYYILIQTCLFPAIYHISVAQSRMTEADNGCRAGDGAHVKGRRSQASPVVGEDLEFLILLPQALGKELRGPSCPRTPSFQDETLQNHSSHPLLPFSAFFSSIHTACQ